MNARLSQKLALAFAVLIATLTAAGLANWWGMARVDQAMQENAATVARLDAAHTALAELVEEQNAVRGFVANLDPAFLIRRQGFHEGYLRAMAELRSTLSDPREQAMDRRLTASVAAFERDCEQQLADARSPATLARARAELSTRGRLTEARQIIGALSDIERAQLAARSAAQRQAFAIAGMVLGAGVLAATALALAMGWLLTWTIARPVAALTRQMRRLADGESVVSGPAVFRTDEVGDMARAVAVFRDAAIAKARLEVEAAELKVAKRAHEVHAAEQQMRAELAEEIAGVGHWRRNLLTGEGVWSDELIRIYGLDPAVGALPLDQAMLLFHPEDRGQAEAALQVAAREGVGFARDFRVVRPDGDLRHIQMRAAVERDPAGEVCAMFGVCLDVTEAKRAEQVLRESEERYRLLAENVTDVIAQMTPDGVITFITPACTRMLGWTPDELVGVRMLDLIHPDDADPIVEVVAAHAAAGPDAPPIVIQYRARHKDGRWVWIEGQPRFIFDARGQLVAIQDSVRDITERKAAEERQTLMVHELNHRVKNTLATVQSVAMQTQKSADDPAAFVRAFNSRVAALAHSHDLLTQNAWSGAGLRELVAEHIKAHQRADGARFSLAGPEVRVTPKTAVALGMALGELATNAAKYGALSADEGSVTVSWERIWNGDAPCLRLIWRERGGPPVEPPQRRGFGARLIERGLTHELGGWAHLSFDREGAACEIEFPLFDDAA